ncbi:hypothetical protein PCASD_12067 [Puccinia coronata f. sp. avenae]|uniref:Uncharacterized protein n=1 Tax=Puccinia coronata f. sp. avenae TaxID=200324 RepID=A0A2N5UES1_9BASI|nr:hypothetical protein PCASD_12067 [Puccinia coronata f. sp. avenae]
MMAAVILHNMIIEDERDNPMANVFDYHQATSASSNTSSATSDDMEMFLLRFQAIRSRSTHYMLKEDLINHLWNKRGEDHDKDSSDKSDQH